MTIALIVLSIVAVVAIAAFLISRQTINQLRSVQRQADVARPRPDGAPPTAREPGRITPEEMERNKQAVRKITEAFNTGRVELIDEVVSPAVVDHSQPTASTQRGFNGVKQQIVALRQQFPDLVFEEEMLVAEEDRIILRWKMTGTNTGPIYGRAPTNRTIIHRGTEFIRCKDGKIIEHSDSADVMPFLDKLGILDDQMLAALRTAGLRTYPNN